MQKLTRTQRRLQKRLAPLPQNFLPILADELKKRLSQANLQATVIYEKSLVMVENIHESTLPCQCEGHGIAISWREGKFQVFVFGPGHSVGRVLLRHSLHGTVHELCEKLGRWQKSERKRDKHIPLSCFRLVSDLLKDWAAIDAKQFPNDAPHRLKKQKAAPAEKPSNPESTQPKTHFSS